MREKFFIKAENKAKVDGVEKIVVGGIICKNNKILLLKRKDDDFMGGIYELPSGNLEKNEGIEIGLIREVKEETALDVEKIGTFINTFDYLSGSGKKVRQFNFEVIVDKCEKVFLTEHSEYKWFEFAEIEKSEEITDEVKYCIAIYIYNNIK